jgi:hypothetical protein
MTKVAVLTSDTEQGIKDEIERYMKEYHPQGYGTRVSSVMKKDNMWEAVMKRYESCD